MDKEEEPRSSLDTGEELTYQRNYRSTAGGKGSNGSDAEDDGEDDDTGEVLRYNSVYTPRGISQKAFGAYTSDGGGVSSHGGAGPGSSVPTGLTPRAGNSSYAPFRGLNGDDSGSYIAGHDAGDTGEAPGAYDDEDDDEDGDIDEGFARAAALVRHVSISTRNAAAAAAATAARTAVLSERISSRLSPAQVERAFQVLEAERQASDGGAPAAASHGAAGSDGHVAADAVAPAANLGFGNDDGAAWGAGYSNNGSAEPAAVTAAMAETVHEAGAPFGLDANWSTAMDSVPQEYPASTKSEAATPVAGNDPFGDADDAWGNSSQPVAAAPQRSNSFGGVALDQEDTASSAWPATATSTATATTLQQHHGSAGAGESGLMTMTAWSGVDLADDGAAAVPSSGAPAVADADPSDGFGDSAPPAWGASLAQPARASELEGPSHEAEQSLLSQWPERQEEEPGLEAAASADLHGAVAAARGSSAGDNSSDSVNLQPDDYRIAAAAGLVSPELAALLGVPVSSPGVSAGGASPGGDVASNGGAAEMPSLSRGLDSFRDTQAAAAEEDDHMLEELAAAEAAAEAAAVAADAARIAEEREARERVSTTPAAAREVQPDLAPLHYVDSGGLVADLISEPVPPSAPVPVSMPAAAAAMPTHAAKAAAAPAAGQRRSAAGTLERIATVGRHSLERDPFDAGDSDDDMGVEDVPLTDSSSLSHHTEAAAAAAGDVAAAPAAARAAAAPPPLHQQPQQHTEHHRMGGVGAAAVAVGAGVAALAGAAAAMAGRAVPQGALGAAAPPPQVQQQPGQQQRQMVSNGACDNGRCTIR